VTDLVEIPLVNRPSPASTVDDGTNLGWPGLLAWRVALALAILATWHLASTYLVSPFWIGSPLGVAQRLINWTTSGTLWLHLQITLLESVLGFLIGGVTGVAFGLVLGLAPRLAAVLDPFIVAFYSLPKIALAPLFIVWFGIGITSKVILVTVVVFFLVFYNTYAGTLDVDRELTDAMRLMGASKRQIIQKVVFPSALVWIFTGMKMSVPYALIGAVVGEIMASNRGLGYLIQFSAGQFDTDGVFAALIILMLISTTIYTGLKHSEKYLLRWKTPAG
jgi:NitT/TauT family transport system permease protein